MDRDDLYRHLKENSDVLRNKGVDEAFNAVDRADFVHDDYQSEAYEDYAVPTGHGTSVSKPTLAAFMLELLDAKPGQSVLEVGSGSGYVTALLSNIVGKEGKVVAVESVPALVDQGRLNLDKYDYPQASINHTGPELGDAARGPYDRIFCMSERDEIPEELSAQLAEGGILVMPIQGSVVRAERKNGKLEEKSYPGVFDFPKLS